MACRVWELAGQRAYQHLHVWQRDEHVPGDRGFEPSATALAAEVGAAVAVSPPVRDDARQPLPVNRAARPNQLVLDCVLVEPNEWWIGYHRARSIPARWPGGVCPVNLPPDAVSRAYLKVSEALAWSKLPVARGDGCAEIGSAPGGGTQALLERGLNVVGIDPAEMDARVLAHPRFVHVRKRGAEVRRREFRDVRWLLADSNVAPQHTLDTVEAIVTHRDVHIRGLLLTLKLLDWKLAEQIPDYLERVCSWGYQYVKARQLAFNRQEICVMALRRRAQQRQSIRPGG
jgi:23S rRNA (cytidine2498-2'-O)-methyltransferase